MHRGGSYSTCDLLYLLLRFRAHDTLIGNQHLWPC
jgi:hypothetical protein